MPANFRLLAALLLACAFATAGLAQETLPPPRVLPPGNGIELPAYPAYYRTSRYARWEMYGVDRTGHFRPRVVLTPSSAYYLINGKPFPWWTNRPGEIMAYIVD